MTKLPTVPVKYRPIANVPRVIEVARILGRQSAYDAAYIELAEALNTELWTLDGPLYRNAIGHGFKVQLVD